MDGRGRGGWKRKGVYKREEWVDGKEKGCIKGKSGWMKGERG